MATISYHNAVQPAGSATGTAITRPTPAALQNNDLLLAVVTHSSALTATPSGWTLVKTQAYTALTTTHNISVYRKTTVTSADSAVNVDFTQATSGPWSMGTIAFRAGEQYTIQTMDALSNASNNVASFTGTPPALTSTKAQEMFVFALGTLKADSAFASTGPTSATTWTGTTAAGKYQSGSYLGVTGAATSSGSMVYDSSAVTDNALGMVSLRFYATPAPDTVTEGVNLAETAAPGWNAATALAEDVELSEETLFGFQYLESLTDNFDLTEFVQLGRMVDAEDAMMLADETVGTPVIGVELAETIRYVDLAYRAQRFSPVVSDAVDLSLAQVRTYAPRPTIVDRVNIRPAAAPNYLLGVSASDRVRLADALLAGLPVSVVSAMTTADVLLTVRGVQVMDRLGIQLGSAAATRYGLSFVDTIRLRDSLANFFGADASDTVSFSHALLSKKNVYPSLTDAVGVDDNLSPYFVLRVTAADSLGLSDDEALRMVFGPTILDGVQISAAYIQPSGSITTWAVNTMTGATTQYENFNFNSFARMGNTYLAASSSGLYELVGDTDDGDDIIAQLKSGFAQFTGSRYTSFKAAYLGMRGDGYVFLKLDTGDGKSYTYRSMLQNMQTTKVLLGKGLRARYFSFELVTEGQDFDLDTIEFVPIMANRRV